MILVDTNVLARSLEQGHLHYQAALSSLSQLRRQNEDLILFPQNLIEFYALATRANNSLKFTPDQAVAEVAAIEQQFIILPEDPLFFAEWKRLISRYHPTNRRVYDFRLVALMLLNRIPTILTFNDKDFEQIQEIKTLNPFDLLGIPRQ